MFQAKECSAERVKYSRQPWVVIDAKKALARARSAKVKDGLQKFIEERCDLLREVDDKCWTPEQAEALRIALQRAACADFRVKKEPECVSK